MDDYSKEPIEKQDLQIFTQRAWKVLRGTPYGEKFSKHVILIALCQGGANHYAVTHGFAKKYLDPKKAGLKDIDIWFFFNEPGFHPLWKKKGDLGPSKFGKNPNDFTYIGRRMDFFGRSIEYRSEDNPQSALVRWLKKGKYKSPRELAKKAVVALYPENIIGEVLWVNPELQ